MLKVKSLISLCKIFASLLCVSCSMHPLYSGSYCRSSSGSISVNTIPGRAGQRLYGFLEDYIRDIRPADKTYRLNVNLSIQTVPYALADDGNAQRLKVIFTADTILKDYFGTVIFHAPIRTTGSRNIVSSQGDVLLNIYEMNDSNELRDLAFKIVEQIKISINHEGRI
ncbi:MAG: hypothetical protein E7015_02610 [Alphaproteobacteria bacterium]|nr:hypothetical protein [Alphaproteobacteria bacterium]